MATTNFILQTTPTQYVLSDTDRQAILAQSSLARRTAAIARQREVFIDKNGHDGRTGGSLQKKKK